MEKGDYSVECLEENESNEVETSDYNIPCRVYGDFYCKACDSHMNSENMWESHIQGKRHESNLKKGETDFKYEYLNVEAKILSRINKLKDPVVGLNYVCEILKDDSVIGPVYQCFLCSSNIATGDLLIEHLLGLKHRLAYIKVNAPEEYKLIESIKLKEFYVGPLILENAAELEAEFGRGNMIVKRKKPKNESETWKIPVQPAKKIFKLSMDETSKPVTVERQEKGKPNWKNLDYGEKEWYHKKEWYHNKERKPCSTHNLNSVGNEIFLHEKNYKPINSFGHIENRIMKGIDPLKDTGSCHEANSSYLEDRSRYDDYDKFEKMLHSSNHEDNRMYEKKNSSSSYDDYGMFSNGIGFEEWMTTANASPATQTSTNAMKDILSKIIAMPPIVFLKFVHCKMDSVPVTNEEEVNILQKIIKKATTFVVELKLKAMHPNELHLFEEIMSRNGIKNTDISQLNDILKNIEKKDPPPAAAQMLSNSRDHGYSPNNYGSNLTYVNQIPSFESERYTSRIEDNSNAVSRPPTHSGFRNSLNTSCGMYYPSSSHVAESSSELLSTSASSEPLYSLFSEREYAVTPVYPSSSSNIPGLTLMPEFDYESLAPLESSHSFIDRQRSSNMAFNF